jgi:hypothetical protein
VYFNADHPENQTVRKTIKKSYVTETRFQDDYWTPGETQTVVRQLLENLVSLLNVRLVKVSFGYVGTILYESTKRGPLKESVILNRFRDPNMVVPNTTQTEAQMTRFTKTMTEFLTVSLQNVSDEEIETMRDDIRDHILNEAMNVNLLDFTSRDAEHTLKNFLCNNKK